MTENTAPLPVHQAASSGRRLAYFRAQQAGPNQGATVGTIVNRSRHAIRNNPWAGASIQKYVINAIATGIQAKPVNGTDAQKAVSGKKWKRWIKVSDADGQLDFYGQQALAATEWKEAGEVFARLRWRRRSDGLPVPIQVQLIESEQCPRDHTTTAPNGNIIREGIELDKIGRRVAYWMYRKHPGDYYVDGNDSTLYRIPADEILHLYRPVRAGQLRGIPDISAVLPLILNADLLNDNVMMQQQVSTLMAGWFTRTDTSQANGPLGESQIGTDVDSTPIAGMEPGTMSELPPGWDVKFNTPPAPGANYAEFMRLNLMAFAARIGIPIEVLTGDLRNVSDRALKLVLLEFHRLIEMDQWLYFIPMFCGKIRDAWWDALVLDGGIDAPDYYDDPEHYRETLWMPEGWPYAHPVQDVTADEKAVAAGFTTRSRIVLRRGEDPLAIDAEQAADNARADALGLKYTSDGRVANADVAPVDQNNQDNNQ